MAVCWGAVNMNSLQNTPAGPFAADFISFLYSVSRSCFWLVSWTAIKFPPPLSRRFSIPDTYQAGAWDQAYWTHRRSLYPVSERTNRSRATRHTLPPDCLGHHGPEKRGRENRERVTEVHSWKEERWDWMTGIRGEAALLTAAASGIEFSFWNPGSEKQWLWHLSGRGKQRLGSCAVKCWGFTEMPLM